MGALTEQKRDDLKALLEDHTKVTDALFNLPKSVFVVSISVTDEENDDFTEVTVTKAIAKKALLEHLAWVNGKLEKFGITVKLKE